MRRLILFLCLCALAAGCLTERTLRDVPDGERHWRIGYRDGCHSGRFRAGLPDRWERERDRYRADDLYRRGWKEGYDTCFREATKRRDVVPKPPRSQREAETRIESDPEQRKRDTIQERIDELESELSELKGRLEESQ